MVLGNQTRVEVSFREPLKTKRAFLAHLKERLETKSPSKRDLKGGLVSKVSIRREISRESDRYGVGSGSQ